MATKKKTYKRLTNKEKAWNKEFKQQMIASGLIPPPKKKLNRKKFVKEVRAEYKEHIKTFVDLDYLMEAIAYMLPSEHEQITSEEVGVCKVLKMAVEIKKYKEALLEAGEEKYNLMELYKEVIDPIRKL